ETSSRRSARTASTPWAPRRASVSRGAPSRWSGPTAISNGGRPARWSDRAGGWRSRCAREVRPRGSRRAAGLRSSSVGLRGRRRSGCGGCRSGRRLFGGGLVGSRFFRGGFFGLSGLLPRFGGIVGDVPALALQDERRRRQQPVDLASASFMARQRRLGDALPDLEHPSALVALVFIRWHGIEATWEGIRCQHYELLRSRSAR